MSILSSTLRFPIIIMSSFKSVTVPLGIDEDFAYEDDGDCDIILSKDELELLQVS